ncbi:hypothetical protein RhiirC2_804168 [Rhizophagus irregularis]|uniref:Uncharacterized protein n=1 Tax=Rhizophagus irregularis TaxID=588596 RepID=A0A2N1L3I7_9GLOM|nr:hypothetical protein RhiirC2_804168 [Rhizophagus irregularis]
MMKENGTAQPDLDIKIKMKDIGISPHVNRRQEIEGRSQSQQLRAINSATKESGYKDKFTSGLKSQEKGYIEDKANLDYKDGVFVSEEL